MITRAARWTLEHDPDVTSECYRNYVVESPCDCSDCRNFRAVKESPFPVAFRDLASRLGIDLHKPSELCHYGTTGQGGPTGGWYHFVGKILTGDDAWVQSGETSWVANCEAAFGISGLGFTDRIALLPDAFEGHQVVQLEFNTDVAWVLEE